jgi:Flp pilus assembly protein TadG
MRPRRNEQRGAAAVEFALVLPVLLFIVLGTIDWGWYFYVSQVVTNAAREGARAGSLTPTTGSDGTAISDAETTAEAYLTGAGLAGGNATATTAGGAVEVTVVVPTGSLTGFTDLVAVMPANSQAVARMRR